jgi:hypothetical protein
MRSALILYSRHSCYTPTVLDHLLGFRLAPGLSCYYADAVAGAPCNVDLELFDVVVVHYSTALYQAGYFSRSFADALRGYSGLKVAFTQDEYDGTETLRRQIEILGIHIFFTCVPAEHVQAIYPNERFPQVRFVPTLTGYAPLGVDTCAPRKPIGERPIHVGYRGRALSARYGLLAREKLVIGQRMKAECERAGILCDIAWDDKSRIYWQDWYRFLENCRVTLGTESGSNVFDFDGSIRKAVDAALQRDPGASFEKLYAEHVAAHEGRHAQMNQISPRIFEAIALRTGLVLFEGNYSGILRPDVHYIPLRKDFGNVEEVLRKVRDEAYLTELTTRAFDDVIAGGRYSYEAFARELGHIVQVHAGPARPVKLLTSLVAGQREQVPWIVYPQMDPDRASLQLERYQREVVAVFPLVLDPLGTATTWPLFDREYDVIKAKSLEILKRDLRQGGVVLLEDHGVRVATALNLRARGFGLLFIAMLALPYPLLQRLWRLLPLRFRLWVRTPKRGP